MDRILHPETRLLVCDGRKALFLRNGGPAGRPAFEVEQEMHIKYVALTRSKSEMYFVTMPQRREVTMT